MDNVGDDIGDDDVDNYNVDDDNVDTDDGQGGSWSKGKACPDHRTCP